jgi:hypothetical protein
MKIDLQSGSLFTDAGKFLKRLHCPKAASWDDMEASAGSSHRTCFQCAHTVHDTAVMTDAELEQLMEREPTACLKLSLTQSNCTVLPGRLQAGAEAAALETARAENAKI